MPRARTILITTSLMLLCGAPATLRAQGITFDTPLESASVVAPPLRFEGVAPPELTSAKLYLYEGAEPMPPTVHVQDVVIKGGRWSLELDEAQVRQLKDGPHTAAVLPLGDTMLTGMFVTFGLYIKHPLRLDSPGDGALLLTEPVRLQGTTAPDVVVQVRLNDAATPAEVRADAAGAWTLELTPTPPPGFHLLRASVLKAGTAASTERAVMVDLAAGDPDRDAQGVFTTASPTLQGLATEGLSVELTIDNRVAVTRPVTTGGRWTYDVEPPLEDGAHRLAIRLIDAQGQLVHGAVFDLTSRDDSPTLTSQRCAAAPSSPARSGGSLGALVALALCGLGSRARRREA